MNHFDDAVRTMCAIAEHFRSRSGNTAGEERHCLYAYKGMLEAIGAFRGTLSRNVGIATMDPGDFSGDETWPFTSTKTQGVEPESSASSPSEPRPAKSKKKGASTGA